MTVMLSSKWLYRNCKFHMLIFRYSYSKLTLMYDNFVLTLQTDASDYFTVNGSSGFLYQIKSFDYEDTGIQCRLGLSSYLTITAQVNSNWLSS